MKTLLGGFGILVISALLTGCGTTAKFVYPAKDATIVRLAETPRFAGRVAVPPFDDQRGNENSSGTMWLYAIPLMPYGYIEYDRPDAARMFCSIAQFEFTPTEDLAKAAAYSLRKSCLFDDAFFTFGADKDKANYILCGTVTSSRYTGKIISYGVSVVCPYLWILGLPCGTSKDEIALQLSLVDGTSKKVLWQKSYEMTDSITQGLYYEFGHDVLAYSQLMQEIMNDAVRGINQALIAAKK